MDAYHQDLRRAADKAFIESLEQLEQMLLDEQPTFVTSSSKQDNSTKQPAIEELSPFDLAAFEEADADIEAFMQQRFSSKDGLLHQRLPQ